ncbi:MAG TPA: hypothetical protein VD996_06725, partial [Chitinophagaceae bacterium]|nr:hypothetical protein [Chitinophagaceae bacterium]
YLIKSVYRFMAKMENLNMVEEEIFAFLRNSFHIAPARMRHAFRDLLSRLKQAEQNRFATRAFFYLDIISWLESKINNTPVQDVIRRKFLEKNAG